jgi:hypothetical protein
MVYYGGRVISILNVTVTELPIPKIAYCTQKQTASCIIDLMNTQLYEYSFQNPIHMNFYRNPHNIALQIGAAGKSIMYIKRL